MLSDWTFWASAGTAAKTIAHSQVRHKQVRQKQVR
jgi:hypothetical protein